jgi:predicted nucleic-acid-binding Zn-ribbon protein
MIKCSQCGGTKFEQGSLSGFGAIKIHSVEGSGFNAIPVTYICQDCGHIEIFTSPQEHDK